MRINAIQRTAELHSSIAGYRAARARCFISRGPVHCVPDARLKCNFAAADERAAGKRTDGREDGKLEAEESGSDDKGAPNVPIFRS